MQTVRPGAPVRATPVPRMPGPELSRCSPPSSSTGRGWPSSSPSSRRSAGCWRCWRSRSRSIRTSCRRRCRSRPPIRARPASVVDDTIAQPIEAQVVGVDKTIYMKSVSGDDGSYSLTVSFELGTNPDINTVNVNNRVQVALSKLPADVQKQGVTVKKKSSALLGVIAVYSPKKTHDPLFLSNYVTINLLDQIKSTPGVGDAVDLGPAGLRHARLGADRPAHRPQPDHRRHHQRHPGAERAGRGRPHRRAPDLATTSNCSSTSRPRGGSPPSRSSSNIVIRTNADGSVLRLGDVARVELGAANLDRETRLNGASAAADRDLPGARRQCDCHAARGARQACRAGEELPRRRGLEGHLRPDGVRDRHHPRGAEDADRGLHPGGARGVPVPRQLARHADSRPSRCR